MYFDFLQQSIHYGLHFLFPAIPARIFYSERWKKAWIIMLLTMLVDLDHLLSKPVFDSSRCSIGFHPLHTWWAIGVYLILLYFPRFRIVAIGLLLHMLTDWQDSLWM